MVEDEQGRVVSAAQSSAEGGSAAMLGGVATLDEYRGQGLINIVCCRALHPSLLMPELILFLFYLKDTCQQVRLTKLGFHGRRMAPGFRWAWVYCSGIYDGSVKT